MDDDIQLPPLPALGLDTVRKAEQIFNYARTAVLADRARRAKVEVKPVVHETTLRLAPDGYAWHGTDIETKFPPRSTLVTIRWTNDGRAWIDSERNRALAQRLRLLSLPEAADALDGGM